MAPDEIRPSAHPDLAAQVALYETPRIITTLGHIHTAHCYAGSNCTLIEGEDGAVLVDTLTGEVPGDEAAAAFKEITDKPIKAVIVTHFHPDHVGGIFSFVSAEDIGSGAVEVIGFNHEGGAATGFSSVPTPSTVTATTSPGFM